MQPPSGSTLSSPLARLIEATLHHMRGLGYSPQYMDLCHGVWKSFVSFTSQVSGNETFSAPLVAPFLASRGITEPTSSGLSSRQCLIRASMRMLTDFHFHGCSQRCRHTRQRVSLPPLLHHPLQQYETFCHDHLRCSLKTIRTRMRHLTQFLHFLDAHAVSTCAAIEPKHLSDFICSQVHLIPKTLAGVVSNLRSFFRFLCMQNLIADDLSPHLPKIRIPRHAQIPSVWRPEDVVALLAAVDRSSPKGKRDYAILLLACRLGLRVSDIRMLRLKAPLEPFGENDNLHHIITFYRKRAGITLPAQKLQGLHSLRHTMATRLLEVGTPFETIAAVLGHRSLESTRIYTKVALEALRSAALEVEETCHV